MDELETWELLEAQTSRRKPWETVADWRPFIMIMALPLSDADMKDVIERAATEWDEDHGWKR